jgi:hypothetical protein
VTSAIDGQWRWQPVALALFTGGLFVAACGGRTELVVLPQVGQLSERSAVANDADVRLIVRSDAWTEADSGNAPTIRHLRRVDHSARE